MRIVLIGIGLDIDMIGIRVLASILKQRGYNAELLFIPNLKDELIRRGFHRDTVISAYNEAELKEIAAFCKDADLVGLSLISRDLDASIQVTEKLKKSIKAPLIWGGFHPTVCPADCLAYADIVCIGEAENSLLELVELMKDGKDYSGVSGIWIKQNNVRNPVSRLIDDLDTIPYPDYDFSTHYYLQDDKIVPFTKELLEKYLVSTYPSFKRVLPGMEERIGAGITDYHAIGTRGCPHNCAFCGSPQLKKIYNGQKFIRRRSVDNLIGELKQVKERFEFITDVHFCDDCFMLASVDYIREFSEKYKKEINLPFYCLTSPATITESKLRLLVDAGLSFLSVGIQSASKKTLAMYKRGSVNKGIHETLELINSYKDRLFPYYDFLIDNPFETDEDLLDTLDLIKRIKRPYKIRIYSLVFFPGTELFIKQEKDNLLGGSAEDLYRKDFAQRSNDKRYLNFLIDISRYQLPKGLLIFLTNNLVTKIFTRTVFRNAVKMFYRMISLRQYIKEKRRYKQGEILSE